MNAPELTRGRITAALVVAVLTDLIQLPLQILFFTGFLAIPAEVMDIFTDAVAFVATTLLLGFHWALLPTAALETVPIVAAMPTWTGCVAFVIWQRKQELAATASSAPATAQMQRLAVTRDIEVRASPRRELIASPEEV